jgi:hypothetical protein
MAWKKRYCRNSTGDLALRWEVARDRRLGRLASQLDVVAALKTHTIPAIQGFQSGETSSIPGACVPLATEDFSAQELALTLIRALHADLAQPAENFLA